MGFFKQLIAVLALLCATCAQAEVMVGKDYNILGQPQPVASGNKIEVLEFFSYSCSHCYHLHPLLSAWEKKMPKDVALQYVPVVFGASQEPMAHAFYALEMLGKIGQLHDPLFVAWNVTGVDLSDEEKIAEFVAKHGVDRKKFSAEFNSFSVSSKVARSNQWVLRYGIRGTPTMIVDGKYVITNLHPEDTIRVLDEVIKIARKERSKR
jgi:protein dithiol oxidoreductase (disulfide-forming)